MKLPHHYHLAHEPKVVIVPETYRVVIDGKYKGKTRTPWDILDSDKGWAASDEDCCHD